MRRRFMAFILISAFITTFLNGCTDSRQKTDIEQVEYDPAVEAARYEIPEIPEADKDFMIEMGYNNCDHMVGGIIGERAGIYEALGLNVNLTKTNNTNIAQAMSTDQMHVAYMGSSAYAAHNEGAPICLSAANHLGGSYYLVLSNDIEDPKDLVGKTISISQNAENTVSWLRWSSDLGIPKELDNYDVVEMGQADAPAALASGQIDAYTCWDPYASQAEIMGIGHIVGIDWGTDTLDEKGQTDWNICCMFGMNSNFKKDHPELAERLIIAHMLSLQYIYQHPYNAAMMFAEGFGTEPEVGLLTIYMKTVAEGRTLNWIYEENSLQDVSERQKEYGIDEKYIQKINDPEDYIQTDILEASDVDTFEEFSQRISLDETFPIGMTFDDWLQKAKSIDGIESNIGDDIETPQIYLEEGYSN